MKHFFKLSAVLVGLAVFVASLFPAHAVTVRPLEVVADVAFVDVHYKHRRHRHKGGFIAGAVIGGIVVGGLVAGKKYKHRRYYKKRHYYKKRRYYKRHSYSNGRVLVRKRNGSYYYKDIR